MDRYYVDPGDFGTGHGIGEPSSALPCPVLDGVSISCTLGNGCQSDRLLPEQDTAAMDNEPLGNLRLVNLANGV